MNKDQTISDIEQLLHEMSVMLDQKGREILAQSAVTFPQFSALLWLKNDGDMTIGELSQKLFLACSTTTDLIDRMERSEIVERVRDDRDRRIIRIHILPKGHKVIDEVIAARRIHLTEVFLSISDDQMLEMKKYLALLCGELKKT
ncbi:winged helix-turn-helix transcriptional regulator [Hazenella sp. IB182353]|nr:MarR family winged helix-turn-helix transcriptional regulator [Polycladospora coralii]MBS7529285.1 winged helix-turn-helix transcriptional regulator [Polycladospora coralii]